MERRLNIEFSGGYYFGWFYYAGVYPPPVS